MLATVAPALRLLVRTSRLALVLAVLCAALLTVITVAQVVPGAVASVVASDPCAPTAYAPAPCAPYGR